MLRQQHVFTGFPVIINVTSIMQTQSYDDWMLWRAHKSVEHTQLFTWTLGSNAVESVTRPFSLCPLLMLLYLPCLPEFRQVIPCFMLAGSLGYSETSLNFYSHRWLWRVYYLAWHHVVRESSQSFRRTVPHPSSGSEICYASSEQERSNTPNELKECSSETSGNYDPSVHHMPEDSNVP